MSSLKTILLHVDASPCSVIRLEAALELANRHQASITAVFTPTSQVADAGYAYSACAAVATLAAEQDAAANEHAKRRLLDRVDVEGAEITWADARGGPLLDAFVREAAYADLLVLGQRQRGDDGGGQVQSGFVEHLIIRSGKPTIVIPFAGLGRSLGRRVLIAWNGSPQAARALSASLPLLRQAESVHVLGWTEEPMAGPLSRLSIDAHLARHGVAATVERRATSPRMRDELVQAVAEARADLVVMGCYGHGRVTELLLGGATRSALASMSVATLMAH